MRITRNGEVLNVGADTLMWWTDQGWQLDLNGDAIPDNLGRVNAPAGTRAQPTASGLLTAGTYLGGNMRIRHVLPVAAPQISVAYGNFYNNAGVETDGPDPFTIRAAIEYPAGVFTPLYFGGRRDVTIDSGAVAWSDHVNASIPAGAYFWTRTYATVPDTAKRYPIFGPSEASYGEGGVVSATPADATTSGTIAAGAGYGQTPVSIRAVGMAPGTPSVGVIGDSIAWGSNDTVTARGWVDNLLGGGSIPYQRVALTQEKAQTFAVPATRRRRMNLLAGCNVAVCEYGINDLNAGRTLVQLQGDLQACWAALAAAGMKVWQTTITPKTTSTDSWATTAGQTPNAWEGIRTALNDWIRTVPAGIVGVLEVADAVESGRNSGAWAANGTAGYFTSDGLHPSTVGHQAIAAALTSAGAVGALRIGAR